MISEETIRQNLIRMRKKHNMTQGDVADLLFLSRSTYATYEQGVATPSIVLLSRLADIYHTSIEKLTEDDTA